MLRKKRMLNPLPEQKHQLWPARGPPKPSYIHTHTFPCTQIPVWADCTSIRTCTRVNVLPQTQLLNLSWHSYLAWPVHRNPGSPGTGAVPSKVEKLSVLPQQEQKRAFRLDNLLVSVCSGWDFFLIASKTQYGEQHKVICYFASAHSVFFSCNSSVYIKLIKLY